MLSIKGLTHVYPNGTRALDGVGARPIFEATPPWLAGLEPVHGFAF